MLAFDVHGRSPGNVPGLVVSGLRDKTYWNAGGKPAIDAASGMAYAGPVGGVSRSLRVKQERMRYATYAKAHSMIDSATSLA